MKPDWNKVKELMAKALDLPAAERAALLAREPDEDTRREVESLLAANDSASDFIERPIAVERGLVDDELSDTAVGREIGGYRIVERIGTGGMGVVYLAVRDGADFQTKFALKLLKRGMDSESIVRRFRRERRILSTLNHPNIASLIDGGIAGDGSPFFVMEYVDGSTLGEHCSRNNVGLDERLAIFRRICAAVEHAHRNLVVHRDIKPSNIIVTPDGTPKLLDFGIAKIISDDDETGTMTGALALTPEYASPEQLAGEPVSTLSDVYCLGVVLYEILCGKRPFESGGRTTGELLKSISETQPARPSETISAPGIDRRTLRGDLDNIVLKAIARTPGDRYASVREFSDDLERFLDGRPVLARPRSWRYRAAKFARRHRVGFAAAVAVFLAIVVGSSLAFWQAMVARRERARAERRFDDVRRLASSMLFDHYERIKTLPGATEAREKLVADALAYLDQLAAEGERSPELQRDLVAAYERISAIQDGSLQSAGLGQRENSRANLMKALSIQEELVGSSAATVGDRRRLALLYMEAGDGDPGDMAEKALAIMGELRQTNPNTVQRESDYARALWYRANTERMRGNNRGAIDFYTESASIYENIAAVSENPVNQRRNAALTYNNIATIEMLENNLDRAIELLQKSLAYSREYFDANPNNVQATMDLSFAHRTLASVMSRRTDFEGAIENMKKALELQSGVVAADPKNQFAGDSRLETCVGLAAAEVDGGKFDDSRRTITECRQLRERGNFVAAKTLARFDSLNAYCLLKSGTHDKNPGALREARASAKDAVKRYGELSANMPNDKSLAALAENAAKTLRDIEREIVGLGGRVD